jgi:hypothetical protein
MLYIMFRSLFAGLQARQSLALGKRCSRRVYMGEESGPGSLDLLTAHLANVFAMTNSPFSRS